jgi:hypothetical protein
MAIHPDTLRKIHEASPFPEGRYSELGPAGVVQRWEDAGLMRHLFERSYSEKDAMRVCEDAPNPEREVDRYFFRGQERLYLKADFRTVEGSRISDAAVARIKQDDPQAAKTYQDVLNTKGAEDLFQYIGAEVRRANLAQVSGREEDLASADDALARRSRGRRM